jgi:(2Fe-2S) ferredoxin
MMRFLVVLLALYILDREDGVSAFCSKRSVGPRSDSVGRRPVLTAIWSSRTPEIPNKDTTSSAWDPQVAQQFKVLTCSATSCSEKRKLLTMDPYATFSAFWGRSADIAVEEASCLGACRKAPCVAIEHEDYEGTVALVGMDDAEFANRVFHRIVTQDDADRVWGILENAVRVMAEQEDYDDKDDEDSGAFV